MFQKQQLLFVAAMAIVGISVSFGDDNILRKSQQPFLGLVGMAAGYRHLGPRAGQRLRDGRTDAAITAGDKSHAPLQAEKLHQ